MNYIPLLLLATRTRYPRTMFNLTPALCTFYANFKELLRDELINNRIRRHIRFPKCKKRRRGTSFAINLMQSLCSLSRIASQNLSSFEVKSETRRRQLDLSSRVAYPRPPTSTNQWPLCFKQRGRSWIIMGFNERRSHAQKMEGGMKTAFCLGLLNYRDAWCTLSLSLLSHSEIS